MKTNIKANKGLKNKNREKRLLSISKPAIVVTATAKKEPPLTSSLNSVSSNEFINYRQKVMKAIEEYEKLPSTKKGTEGFYRTINRKASPFIKGYFTLAIVGKMSAGKSTFINALLGCRDLLPTGHFQTTCVLTKIEHSEEMSIEIGFGDGHKETIKGEVSGKLGEFVAIETEYSSLPVNNINKLIVKGWNKDQICKAETVEGMEATSRRKIDESILEKYISSHPKSKIATEVTIKYPLPEGCQGWRIVDTPGVEAVGGIDIETTEFLTAKNEFGGNNVDAIIILHKGSDNIEDLSINDFVNDIYTPLSDEAKKRLFFVVTNAADEKFHNNEEEYMRKAKALFVDKFNIKNDRLIAVDSLMEILYRYVRENKKDVISMMASKEVPDDSWNTPVWKSCRSLLKDVRDTLEDEGKNVNNETVLDMVQGWSNFEPLHLIINSFVKSEKTNAFNDLIHTIREDVNQNIYYRKNDVTLLQKGIKEMQGEIERLSSMELEMNEALDAINRKFDKEAVKARFDFIECKIKSEIEADDTSYKDIRRESSNLCDLAEKEQKNLFLEIKLEFNKHIQVGQSKVFFKKPDFEEMEKQSIAEATENKAVDKKRKVPGACCDGYEEYTENIEQVDPTKKLKAFRTMSCRHIRTEAKNFKVEIQYEVDKYVTSVSNSLKDSLQTQKEHLGDLLSKYKVSSDQELKEHESVIQCEISILNNFLNSTVKY